jgi:hypothetical protein
LEGEFLADFEVCGAGTGEAGIGARRPGDPRQMGSDELSTAKAQCFEAGYLRMHRKYKILWFELDLHHRQRYFSICGCNRTLKMFGVNYAATARQQERIRGRFASTHSPPLREHPRSRFADAAASQIAIALSIFVGLGDSHE